MLKITFLGTGTSMGVPIIGCNCKVCLSNNIKDKRTRPGILLSKKGFNLLIDASMELRLQLLRERINNIDAIIITHPHADHIFGLDDTRIFTLGKNRIMPIYCSDYTKGELENIYSYVFNETQEGGGKPSFEFIDLYSTKRIGPFNIFPFNVYHGKLLIDAFLIDNIIIILDASYIDYAVFKQLKSRAKIGIINGLRLKPHSTHFSFCESMYLLRRLNIERGYIMHFTHNLLHSELEKMFVENIYPAFDGLTIDT